MLNLPRKDEDGVSYISYSQMTTWKDKKSFNLKIEGKKEYMLSYFLGVDFPDVGWGEFGNKVGTSLEHNDFSKFSEKEIKTLKKVNRLDLFEKEIRVNFKKQKFYLKGFIDTCDTAMTHIKDYKTASEKSKAKYSTDGYFQLDIYALGVKEETGKYPKTMDVEIIERKGNAFRGGVDMLSVGTSIWIQDREVIPTRLTKIKKDILATATEISEYYTVFEKLNIKTK